MFVSQDKNVGKKTFQKPNILRRKPKVVSSRPNISNVNESPRTKCLVIQNVSEPSIFDSQIIKVAGSYDSIITKTSLLKSSAANNNVENNNMNIPQETNVQEDVNSCATTSNSSPTDGIQKNNEQCLLNIETFINKKSMSLPNIDATVTPEKKAVQCKTKWGFDVTNSDTNVMIHDYNVAQLASQSQEIIASAPNRTVSVELISNRAVKFKCDELDCNKGFWSEERLRKHKNSHNRQTSVRPPSQMTIECPVKKVLSDGVEEKCPRTFQVRRELLDHLNTDHTPEDALHRCEVCGRRFFWASGLRAHAQSVCARGGLACAWPGCSRVFRLPCRLREHARAHTGDRPYQCIYPECGWAFRSASKLVRHARRHTDERRHACAACGRAFLRREHLRDHVARHHLPAARPPHRCAHQGCEQSFTNMSTLYMHIKKVHRNNESISVTPAITDQAATVSTDENIYLVSVVGESGAEWHAARTHCTWPLERAPREPAERAERHEQGERGERHERSERHEPTYVLEEDVHVENAEGSASNIYTVRSDLFLHGNVHIDEDSQNIATQMVDSSEAAVPLDTDLCLDSHPTIDLMPEGLMYEDAAVDESSFRVLLMNGEELTL